MRRREFIALMGASVAWPLAAMAQQPRRTYRYGIVAPFPCEGAPINIALSDEMRRRGFINGQNLTIDCHEFGPNVELSSEYAGELVKAKVDVIIAWGDVAIRASPAALSPFRRQNPREEPGALAAHAGICAGGGW